MTTSEKHLWTTVYWLCDNSYKQYKNETVLLDEQYYKHVKWDIIINQYGCVVPETLTDSVTMKWVMIVYVVKLMNWRLHKDFVFEKHKRLSVNNNGSDKGSEANRWSKQGMFIYIIISISLW